jgi:hypothetical protein
MKLSFNVIHPNHHGDRHTRDDYVHHLLKAGG